MQVGAAACAAAPSNPNAACDCTSSASRIAASAMAVGASTIEVPLSGWSGGIACSDGRFGRTAGGDGHSKSSGNVAATKEPTTTAGPKIMVRSRIRIIFRLRDIKSFPPARY